MSDFSLEPPKGVTPWTTAAKADLEDKTIDDFNNHAALTVGEPNSTKATTNDEVGDNEDGTFVLFPKLPVEVRMVIWGLAAPDPCILVQAHSFGSRKHKHKISRPVPALLHTCRESRNEYLESSSEQAGAQQHNRKRDHPVYKLLFRENPALCSPVFFSASVDTFLGQLTLGNDITAIRNGEVVSTTLFEAFMVPDVASSVQHLAIRQLGHSNGRFEFLLKTFPKLRSITMLIDLHKWKSVTRDSKRYMEREQILVDEEVDGQLDFRNSNLGHVKMAEVSKLQNQFAEVRKKHPDWNSPELKIRGLSQFLQAEHIDRDIFRLAFSTYSMCLDP